MTRIFLTWSLVSLSLGGVVVPCAQGQANAPMQVAASSDPSSTSQPAAQAERDLRQFAQQVVARPAQPTAIPVVQQPLPVAPQPTPGLQVNAPSQAVASPAATPVPPVVAPDPNESKPLGTKPASRTADGGEASSTIGGKWGILQTIFALAFVVGLILVGKQVLLRLMGRPAAVNRSRVVEVLSRVSVGPRQQIMLLRLGGRILVVGDSAGQMRILANLDEPEEVAGILKSVTASKPTSISESFNQLMGKFDQDFDKAESTQLRDEGTDVHEHQADRARDQLSGLLARMRSMAGRGGA